MMEEGAVGALNCTSRINVVGVRVVGCSKSATRSGLKARVFPKWKRHDGNKLNLKRGRKTVLQSSPNHTALMSALTCLIMGEKARPDFHGSPCMSDASAEDCPVEQPHHVRLLVALTDPWATAEVILHPPSSTGVCLSCSVA